MKVITQLVRHFWQRGALSSDEVEYLLRHGFVRQGDLPGYKKRKQRSPKKEKVKSPQRAERPDTMERIEEHLVQRQKRRLPRRWTSRSGEIQIEEIAHRLRQEFTLRKDDLSSVLQMGKKFAEVDTWNEAAMELRGVNPTELRQQFCSAIQTGEVSLKSIWRALDPEPFHHLLTKAEARGRAARSFLAMLVADGPDELGKYAWVLKHDEIQSMLNLRVLHIRLLESLYQQYQTDRLLLAKAIANSRISILSWVFVILYNAERDPPAHIGEAPRYGVEYGPVFVPDLETWNRAWTSAVQMDRTNVTRLLVEFEQNMAVNLAEQNPSAVPADFSTIPLMCPVDLNLPS